MTTIKSISLVFTTCLLLSCEESSRSIPVSSEPSLPSLYGDWEGFWSWDRSARSKISIGAHGATITNLPYYDEGTLKLLSSSCVVEKPQLYGVANNWALLMTPVGGNGVIAMFVQMEDKTSTVELIYSVREHFEEKIVFRKKAGV